MTDRLYIQIIIDRATILKSIKECLITAFNPIYRIFGLNCTVCRLISNRVSID